MATRNRTKAFIEYRDSYRKRTSGGSTVIEMKSIGSNSSADTSTQHLTSHDSLADSSKNQKVPTLWLKTIETINYDITRVKKKMEELAELHKKHLLNPGFDDRTSEEEEIEIVTSEITKLFQQTQRKIKQLASGNGLEVKNAETDQITRNLQSNLALQLQDLSRTFKKDQKDYLTRLWGQKKVGNKFFAGPSPIDDPDSDGPLDTRLTSQQQVAIHSNSAAVDQRDKDIRMIAQSINELADIFNDLALLVIDQGTILDRIDYNIEMAAAHTRDGLEELTKAREHQKGYRTRLCIILLLILIFVMVVVIGIKASG